MKKANWIKQTHLLHSDEFICSACEASFSKPFPVCLSCGAAMKNVKYNPSWVDEAEGFSAILDDDW